MATIKAKTAFKKTLENGGIVSKAMRQSGYSESMSKNPQKLTESEGWQELMNQHLPDSLLAKRHKALLNKQEVIIVRDGKESHTELTEQPHADVKAAIDMAYKLKGKYAAEKHEVKGNLFDFLNVLDNERRNQESSKDLAN